jgi:small neutral amino acid transporter SnatA (MarC family)
MKNNIKKHLKEFLITVVGITSFLALVAFLSFLLLPSLKVKIINDQVIRAFEIILFVFICCVSVYLIYRNLKKSKKY